MLTINEGFCACMNENVLLSVPANGRVVFEYRKIIGDIVILPIGLTIDIKGYLYVVLYYGGLILKVDPR